MGKVSERQTIQGVWVHPGRAFTFATIKQLSTLDNDGIAVI